MEPRGHQSERELPTVVVIDDSVEVHRLLNARLRSEPVRLRFAGGGAEGLELVRALDPAVILLDLNMPEVDGFQVLRELKNDPKTCNIPAVVISGLDGSDDKVTAFGLGAQDYVTKPFDFIELRIRLRVALRVNNLVRMLEQQAQIDGLTGLWNRAYFDRRWAEATAGALRHGRPLSLALLDIDHFKSINDTFGHPAGDAVLEGFASLVRTEVRITDIPCRYGGEEFAVIMPDTPPDEATNLCERIRGHVEQMTFPRHPERGVTVSAGVAGAAAKVDVAPDAWVERADANLYRAKREGRNRVVVTDLLGPTTAFAKAG